MRVDILGTEYNVAKMHMEEEDGYTNYLLKEIWIDPECVFFERTLRHELIHAFLWESGLSEYAYDETIVDWMALQFEKIEKAYERSVQEIHKSKEVG